MFIIETILFFYHSSLLTNYNYIYTHTRIHQYKIEEFIDYIP